MLHHRWNDPCQQFAAQLQAGVGVDFDEPNIVVCINHEVQPEYLEIVLCVVRIQLQIGSLYSIKSN